MTKKLIKIALLIAGILLVGSLIAHAYEMDSSYKPINAPFDNANDADDPAGSLILILQLISGGLLYFAAPLAVIMIVLLGMNMNIGGADSEKLEQAKKNITWLLVGLGIIILSYSIVRFLIYSLVGAGNIVQ